MAKVGTLGGHPWATTARVVGFCCLAACENGGSTGEVGGIGRPGAGSGPTVDVAAQRVELGFAHGQTRQGVDLDAFSISRYPVTIGEFRKCVAAGQCAEPPADACPALPDETIMRRPNYKEPNVAEDVPVTCVGVEAARSYCGWVHGRLPTLPQWFLAARGGGPSLYAWGDTAPTCEQHPLAEHPLDAPCKLAPADLGRVALHKAGASPQGVEDVLLTTSELVEPSGDAFFTACKPANTKAGAEQGACVAYSSRPGAIDSVVAITGKTSAMPYGFRCVWGGAS